MGNIVEEEIVVAVREGWDGEEAPIDAAHRVLDQRWQDLTPHQRKALAELGQRTFELRPDVGERLLAAWASLGSRTSQVGTLTWPLTERDIPPASNPVGVCLGEEGIGPPAHVAGGPGDHRRTSPWPGVTRGITMRPRDGPSIGVGQLLRRKSDEEGRARAPF